LIDEIGDGQETKAFEEGVEVALRGKERELVAYREASEELNPVVSERRCPTSQAPASPASSPPPQCAALGAGLTAAGGTAAAASAGSAGGNGYEDDRFGPHRFEDHYVEDGEDHYPEGAYLEDPYPEDHYPENRYPEDAYPEDAYPVNADCEDMVERVVAPLSAQRTLLGHLTARLPTRAAAVRAGLSELARDCSDLRVAAEATERKASRVHERQAEIEAQYRALVSALRNQREGRPAPPTQEGQQFNPHAAAKPKRSRVAFPPDGLLAQVIFVESDKDLQLWFRMPGAVVYCDSCEKGVPQSMGSLQGAPNQSQFAQNKFICSDCMGYDAKAWLLRRR